MSKKDFIMKTYGLNEILSQTAEECTELAQACLKMRRVLKGTSDCDETAVQVNILQEMGDVMNCIDVLTSHEMFPKQYAFEFASAKMDRWISHAAEQKKADEEVAKEKKKREMCMGCVLIARCRSDSQFDPPFFARCKEKK